MAQMSKFGGQLFRPSSIGIVEVLSHLKPLKFRCEVVEIHTVLGNVERPLACVKSVLFAWKGQSDKVPCKMLAMRSLGGQW